MARAKRSATKLVETSKADDFLSDSASGFGSKALSQWPRPFEVASHRIEGKTIRACRELGGHTPDPTRGAPGHRGGPGGRRRSGEEAEGRSKNPLGDRCQYCLMSCILLLRNPLCFESALCGLSRQVRTQARSPWGPTETGPGVLRSSCWGSRGDLVQNTTRSTLNPEAEK